MSLPELKYDVLHLADGTFASLCGQISRDYIKFAKKRIFPQLNFDSLSYRELRVLLCVTYFKDPLAGSDISKMMRYDPATVSRATALLVEHGYLNKHNNKYDFRSTVYAATGKGEDVILRYRNLLDEAYEVFNESSTLNLSSKEKQQLYGLLMKMRDRTHGLSLIPKKKRAALHLVE